MKHQDTERRIRQTFENASPDIFDSILSDCQSGQNETVIMFTEKKSYHTFAGKIIAAAVAFVLVVGSALGVHAYRSENFVTATISLDVNPCIEIEVNSKERVLGVAPLNDDARVVLGKMDFVGCTLDVTVNALIGSMLRNGYISELSNSILLSVDTRNEAKGAVLEKKLANEINILLQNEIFSGAVLSQTITEDKELDILAETYGITRGKAELIRQIVNRSGLHTFDELVSLSINELNLLAGSDKNIFNRVSSLGEASVKAYIGADNAKFIALDHVGADEASVNEYECDMDYENGRMIYDIDFEYNGYDYDYDIDAENGDILRSDKEHDDDYNRRPITSTENSAVSAPETKPAADTAAAIRQPSQTTSYYIGEAAAKSTALMSAGVTEADITEYDCELECDDGRTFYEIDFKAGGYEYDCKIDAFTGEVLCFDKDRDDDYRSPAQTTPAETNALETKPAAPTYIGADRAKSIAFSHAGITVSDISDLECELDVDNGRVGYEISFEAGEYDYEYYIDAITGEIIKSEKDRDD
ncbi:MAG: PepSY domain-containing protein [Clostridia bacterium]|nr:PepSY domain-containing protein [Clostridia bacterium]